MVDHTLKNLEITVKIVSCILPELVALIISIMKIHILHTDDTSSLQQLNLMF